MNETLYSTDSAQKDPQTLEREIDRTRADMDSTLGALEKKLSPGHLVDQAMDYLRDHGSGLADGVGRLVKDYPVPMALAGFGVAWMLLAPKFSGNGHDDHDDYKDADDEYAGARAMNRDGGSLPSDSMIAGAKERISSSARQVARQAQAQTDRLAHGLTAIAREQPLMLAAVGLAVGAAIGAALPESDPEDRWLGPTRDKAVEKVKEHGEQAYEQVRAAAVRGVEGVKDAVSNVTGVK